MRYILSTIGVICCLLVFAQPSQTVRGSIVELESQFPLYGARIDLLRNDSSIYKVRTDDQGRYEIKGVFVGKYVLRASLMTYETKDQTIEVTSGRESINNLALSETFVEQEEVVVTARKKGQVINELATISAQQFSVEETNRYPGSRSDPARMASNFAGVQGSDDSRNDIIIRGNSPLGVVWRVEGVDIPNPSHFATSGSTGGPVSVLNNKILANSDFFMSAFPAEYGNSISGVFDLKLRNGNQYNHEFTGQFGFLGTEFLAEGPLNREKKSSYLVMGRYSTLSLFQKLGIEIGTDAVPVYGDGAFKFNWRLKNGGNLSFFGIGGKSEIAIEISNQTELSKELYGQGDRDQYFGTSMASTGLVYKKSLSEKTFITTTLALNLDEQHSFHKFLYRSLDTTVVDGETKVQVQVDSMKLLLGYYFRNTKLSYYLAVNHKINRRHLLKLGLNADGIYMNQRDSVANSDFSDFRLRWDYKGTAFLIQPFAQWKWRATENMDVTAGIHAQYFSLSNSISPFEPRVGWKYRMRKAQSIFAGAGVHSQTQPLYLYNYHLYDNAGDKIYHNQGMDFSKSLHSGFGYEKAFRGNLNFRTEVYYQYLYNIPVEVKSSAFSMINQGSGFQRFFPDTLQNTGTGENYGIEMTLQKYFNKSFFFMLSATFYDSKYTGSDNIARNTSYNGSYVANFLIGKEFKINETHMISAGIKVTGAGGKRYGYVNFDASKEANDLVYIDSAFNERQFKDYFRLDGKVNWRMNAKHVTHEIGIDIVNVLDTQNLLTLAYAPNLADPSAQPIAVRNQLGRLPLFYYKIDFGSKKK
jgi:hypothetical protein